MKTLYSRRTRFSDNRTKDLCGPFDSNQDRVSWPKSVCTSDPTNPYPSVSYYFLLTETRSHLTYLTLHLTYFIQEYKVHYSGTLTTPRRPNTLHQGLYINVIDGRPDVVKISTFIEGSNSSITVVVVKIIYLDVSGSRVRRPCLPRQFEDFQTTLGVYLWQYVFVLG